MSAITVLLLIIAAGVIISAYNLGSIWAYRQDDKRREEQRRDKTGGTPNA